MTGSYFPQNSAFTGEEQMTMPLPTGEGKMAGVLPPIPDGAANESVVENRALEDWGLRLHSAAHEAGDNGLEVLESDLLDLRDEIVFELHQRLL